MSSPSCGAPAALVAFAGADFAEARAGAAVVGAAFAAGLLVLVAADLVAAALLTVLRPAAGVPAFVAAVRAAAGLPAVDLVAGAFLALPAGRAVALPAAAVLAAALLAGALVAFFAVAVPDLEAPDLEAPGCAGPAAEVRLVAAGFAGPVEARPPPAAARAGVERLAMVDSVSSTWIERTYVPAGGPGP